MRKKIIEDITITIVGYSAALVFGLIGGTIAARLLGPAGRGELAAIQVVPSTLAVLAGLGHAQSIAYFTARKPQQAGNILGSALVTSLLASVVILIIGFFLQKKMLISYNFNVQISGVLFLFFIPLNIINSLPWSTIYSFKRFLAWNILRLQPQLVYSGTLVLAWWLTTTDTGWITNTYLLGIALVCVPSSWFVYRKTVHFDLKLQISTLKMMWPYSLMSLLNSGPNMLNQRIDQVLIATWLPAQELGFYVVAVSWTGLLNPVMSALAANLFPHLASSTSRLDADKLFLLTIRWTLVLVVLMILAMLLMTPFVIPLLFGSDFNSAIKPGFILVLASAFLAINLVLANGFRGMGHPEIPLYAEFTGVVVTIIGLGLFLKSYGIMAAAWVSFTSYMCSTIVLGYFIHRMIHLSLTEWASDYRTEAHLAYNAIMKWQKNKKT
jgi:O-antigen/teichoic acid export membrane protein